MIATSSRYRFSLSVERWKQRACECAIKSDTAAVELTRRNPVAPTDNEPGILTQRVA